MMALTEFDSSIGCCGDGVINVVRASLSVRMACDGRRWPLEGGDPATLMGSGVSQGGSSTNCAPSTLACKSVQQIGRTKREVPACSWMRSYREFWAGRWMRHLLFLLQSVGEGGVVRVSCVAGVEDEAIELSLLGGGLDVDMSINARSCAKMTVLVRIELLEDGVEVSYGSWSSDSDRVFRRW
jgi:hypothetical protein